MALSDSPPPLSICHIELAESASFENLRHSLEVEPERWAIHQIAPTRRHKWQSHPVEPHPHFKLPPTPVSGAPSEHDQASASAAMGAQAARNGLAFIFPPPISGVPRGDPLAPQGSLHTIAGGPGKRKGERSGPSAETVRDRFRRAVFAPRGHHSWPWALSSQRDRLLESARRHGLEPARVTKRARQHPRRSCSSRRRTPGGTWSRF